MKRLVYSPKIEAWVNTDYGVIALEPYITAGNVNRKLDQVSTAELTLRNPNKVWTNHHYKDSITGENLVGPIFHPMDPITIKLTRLQGHPIQVFTGFLDESPYLQMFPGTVTLKASCTLKKFLYTYFDAGLPFFEEFLAAHGWQVQEGIGIVNPKAEEKTAKTKGELTDTGFGELLLAVVNEIGRFPKKSIFIEELPDDLIKLVTHLFEEQVSESEEANKQFYHLFHQIIGTAALGEGTLGGSNEEKMGGTHPVDGTLQGVSPDYAEFCYLVAKGTGLSLRVLGAWCLAEGGPPYNPLNIGPGNTYSGVKGGANATISTLHGSLYKGVLASVNGTDQEQIKAIVASPWCPECAGYEELLLGTYERVSVKSTKKQQ